MGFVSTVLPYTDRWYFAEILRGITEHVEAAGHRVAVRVPAAGDTPAAVTAVDRDFADPDCLGAIVAGFKYQPDVGGQREQVLGWERPLVVVGGSVLGFPTVMIDDLGAARIATEHLLSLGHTRVLHFAGTLSGQMDFSVHGRRAKAYRTVMESAGLEPRIIETAFDPDEAHAAASALLASDARPTAIFAVSDEIAFAILAAAREAGLRPGQDLSVVGVDDHPRAALEDLTTVRQLPAEMGASAADLLLENLAHRTDQKQSRLQPIALVKRGSTGIARTR